MDLTVLSLFDGISCGYCALERVGIGIKKYDAYEIDAGAIKVSTNNYSNIEQHGDVFNGDFKQYKGVDLLIGGSPCSWWSNARQCRSDIERKPDGIGYELFKQYLRALDEAKPKYFLYENNHSISRDVKEQITKDLSVDFIMIDSALVCAQGRKRCYWTNIGGGMLKPPEDRNILIGDVIPGALTGAAFRNQKQKDGSLKAMTNIRKDNKSNCLVAYMSNRNCCVEMDNGSIRPLTADEFELLQTLPEGYTACLSESKRKQVIGLGWTVDVIAYILGHIDKAS